MKFVRPDAEWCDGLDGWVLIVRPIHPPPAAAADAAAITTIVATPTLIAIAISITSTTRASRVKRAEHSDCAISDDILRARH